MSDRLMQDVEKTKLEKKLAKRIGKGAAEEMVAKLESDNKEALEARLLDLSKTAQGVINTRNADSELQKLKDQVSERNGLYNQQLNANKELQRLVSLVISERFGDELMDRKVTEEETES